MCGVFAAIAKREARLPEDVDLRVKRALGAIAHRGPDGKGVWVDPTRSVALGHVRLAVLDVRSEANQPFWSDCGRYVLVFNGEIYNYVELRKELAARGERFVTTSDTEVLLKALVVFGTDVINRLNGMWAFVLVDTTTGETLACRDRFGVKPLFTMQHGDVILLASEAKALIAYLGATPPPNRHAIGRYLRYDSNADDSETWFEGIRQFEPACWQRIGRAGQDLPPQRFWNYPVQRHSRSDSEALEQLRALLGSAVNIRTRSDVPLGLSLSGGVDSSTIAWLLREDSDLTVDAYCAWFEPVERSELPRAQSVCERFGHRLRPVPEVGRQQVEADLRTCIYHLDSPHRSTAVVPYLSVCRGARRSLTVMLEGQGADELLLGYPFLYPFAAVDFAIRGEVTSAWSTFRGEMRASDFRSAAGNLAIYASRWYAERPYRRWAPNILRDPALRHPGRAEQLRLSASLSNAAQALELEHRAHLRSLLRYGDAISMSVALESRCPFMDYRVVEFGFGLSLDLLVRHGHGKWLLRQMADQALPKEVAWPARKDGFTNTTVAALRGNVRASGVPRMGASLAIDMGLFSERVREPESMLSLDDTAFYRLMSTMLWLEIFHGNVAADHALTSAPRVRSA
jgi:asparagine synthase (glutamine-hydrolysing)